jgi:hypothetical protein
MNGLDHQAAARRVRGAAIEPAGCSLRGLEPPVFHDASGRRRRLVGVAGGLLAALTALWLCAMIVGATGFGTLPSIPRAFAAHRLLTAARGRHVVASSTLDSRTGLLPAVRVLSRRDAAMHAVSGRTPAIDLQ